MYPKKRQRSGFTLFEMVVVLSIIAVLATLALVGYRSQTPMGAVRAGRDELQGLLRFARDQAIVSGSNAMLIVHFDKANRDKFLRFAGVIVEDGYNSRNWKAVHSGIYLPEGVYVVPGSDDAAAEGVVFDALWPAGSSQSIYDCTNATSSSSIGRIEYPVLGTIALDDSGPGAEQWIGIQFGPDGRVDKADFNACDGVSGSESNQLVVGVGAYRQADTLQFEDASKVAAVVLRVNGVSYAVDDPSAL